MSTKVTAVIPVRAGSRRLKNKNILPFGTTNLLIHKIRQLKQVNGIDEILVSSDCDEMLAMAKSEGVMQHKRPIEYCDEKTKTFNEVVEYIANYVQKDIIMWAPCVCPLVSIKSYEEAIITYKEKVEKEKAYDSVVSTKLFKEYLFGENGPINFSRENHVPSQYLPDWNVIINGFYIMSKEKMFSYKYIYGNNPFIINLPKKEAIDIDDEEDFIIAKALLEGTYA